VKRIRQRLAWAIASLALGACGGGVTEPTVKGPASPGGIWKGQMMAPSGAILPTFVLVSEDGRFFSVAQQSDDVCANVAQGTLLPAGDNYSGNGNFGIISATGEVSVQIDCAFSDGSVGGTSTLNGSFVPRSTLNLDSADTTSLGTPLQGIVGTLTFDDVYNEASSLSTVAGVWPLSSGALLTIAGDGSFSTQDVSTGCVLTGKVSVIDAHYNAYAVSGTYTACQASASAFTGASAAGLMTLDNTQSAEVIYMGYSVTLSGGEVVVIVLSTTH
jgi:hypothetical protein